MSRATRTTTRERILEAARVEESAGALTVNGVAARAGISRQAVHYHFGGLRGLRRALAANGSSARAPDVSTRERLIDAAERLLSGPAGGEASVEAIAAEAGLTKGAFYHYFPDRSSLLRELARRVSPVEVIQAALEGSKDGTDRDALIALARAYYGAMTARADLIRNLVANTSRDAEIAEIVMHEILSRGAPILLGWFRARIAAGTLRVDDPALAVQAIFGPAFARVVLGPSIFGTLNRFGVLPATERVDAYVDMLLEGLAPRPERS